ncbi:hypothetical protein RND71_031267 [Anisodus tanguticus]|uniref:Uncharacterized protein n=1 Tax=Anisodus tanguticus TaxID=243964 RepID=A0AAE1RDA8_9SOLA|nr:hypothetical protein RND71_031267 [Anisodus tanguticus]
MDYFLLCNRAWIETLHRVVCVHASDEVLAFSLIDAFSFQYQVKAFLSGDSPPFSAGELEGIASTVNMTTRVVRRLSSSSLRYWILEYLRRQPKGKRYRALVLRFVKDRDATILLTEIGVHASSWMSTGVQIGDEVDVQVEEAHPRDDVLSLKEVEAV